MLKEEYGKLSLNYPFYPFVAGALDTIVRSFPLSAEQLRIQIELFNL